MGRSAKDIAAMTAWPQLGIAPGPVLRVFGLRRSGNHAVINWLQRNAPDGRAIFFNNCTAGRDPFRTFRAVEIDGRRVGGAGGDAAEYAARAGEGATLILSYEDAMPNERRKRPVSAGIDERLIDAEVIVARSFLNWAASLVKKLQVNPDFTAHQRVGIVLKAVATYSSMLDILRADPAPGVVAIRYDDWVATPTCRAATLARLGFANRDDSLGPVQGYGNGSSFQDSAETGAQLRIAERWRQMADDPEYRIVLWLAAQDGAFCDRLAASYPDDADRLKRLTGTPPAAIGPRQVSAHRDAPAHILRRN